MAIIIIEGTNQNSVVAECFNLVNITDIEKKEKIEDLPLPETEVSE